MRYFFFKYLTAEIELYYSNVHLATPLSDKRLPIIVQSYKLTPVTARIGHCDEIWRDLRTTAKEIAIRFRTVTAWYWHKAKFVNEIPKDCLKCYMITRRWIAAFFRSLTSQLLSRLNCIVLWYRTNISLTKRNTCIGSCIAMIYWLFNWLLLKVFHSAIDTDTM